MTTLSALSIDHVNMTVKNLQESVEFYGKLFGFEVREDQPDQDSKIIGNDTIKLCLYEDPEMSPEGGISHFGFHVENFGEIVRVCKSLGVEVLYGGEVSWKSSLSVYIKDPNGYVIELSNIQGGGL